MSRTKPDGCPDATWLHISREMDLFLGRGRFASSFELDGLELRGLDCGMAWYKCLGRREVQKVSGEGLFATVMESEWIQDWFYVQIPSELAFEVDS